MWLARGGGGDKLLWGMRYLSVWNQAYLNTEKPLGVTFTALVCWKEIAWNCRLFATLQFHEWSQMCVTVMRREGRWAPLGLQSSTRTELLTIQSRHYHGNMLGIRDKRESERLKLKLCVCSTPLAGSNSCSDKNGGCQQLCLPHRDTRQCRCTAGFTLNDDQTSCRGKSKLDQKVQQKWSGKSPAEICSYQDAKCTVCWIIKVSLWTAEAYFDLFCTGKSKRNVKWKVSSGNL